MSQVTHPQVPLTGQVRAHRRAAIAGLLALLATVAVVLVLTIGGESSQSVATPSSTTQISHPNESGIAAAVGKQPTGPSESNVAAAVGKQPSGPSESNVAAAISGPR